MKNLGVALTDETDQKLDEIMRIKGFKNRADAIEYLIQTGFERLIKEKLDEVKE